MEMVTQGTHHHSLPPRRCSPAYPSAQDCLSPPHGSCVCHHSKTNQELRPCFHICFSLLHPSAMLMSCTSRLPSSTLLYSSLLYLKHFIYFNVYMVLDTSTLLYPSLLYVKHFIYFNVYMVLENNVKSSYL